MLKKVGIIAALIAITAWGPYQFAGWRVTLDGSGTWPRFVSREPDYDLLEADRARQREHPLPTPAVSADSPQPRVAPATATEPARIEATTPPVESTAEGTGARGRGYWPDFRGPSRDGRYDETAIRTDWPKDGLPRLWKQPIGLGYGSFVVADGRAFTIEQRRRQEVVAAYDVETGREL